jgi:hypothetical protein
VLIHQGNPAAFIRSAASHVRRGGIIAFHEIGIYGECQALPPVPLWQQTWSWAIAGLRIRDDASGCRRQNDRALPRRGPEAADDALRNPGRRRPGFPVLRRDGTHPCAACCHKSRRLVLPRPRRSISTPWRTLRNAVTAVHGEALCPMQFRRSYRARSTFLSAPTSPPGKRPHHQRDLTVSRERVP